MHILALRALHRLDGKKDKFPSRNMPALFFLLLAREVRRALPRSDDRLAESAIELRDLARALAELGHRSLHRSSRYGFDPFLVFFSPPPSLAPSV